MSFKRSPKAVNFSVDATSVLRSINLSLEIMIQCYPAVTMWRAVFCNARDNFIEIRDGEPIYYHGPHELWNIIGWLQNQLILS